MAIGLRDPSSGRILSRDADERFWEKVHLEDEAFPENGCMIWTRSLRNGYSAFSDQGRHRLAHHWAYERYRGPIPPGLELDHLCRRRNCVNPDHLEPVTRAVNHSRSDITLSAIRKQRTHCPNGHEFTLENTYNEKNGARRCRICRANNMARFKQKQRKANSYYGSKKENH